MTNNLNELKRIKNLYINAKLKGSQIDLLLEKVSYLKQDYGYILEDLESNYNATKKGCKKLYKDNSIFESRCKILIDDIEQLRNTKSIKATENENRTKTEK